MYRRHRADWRSHPRPRRRAEECRSECHSLHLAEACRLLPWSVTSVPEVEFVDPVRAAVTKVPRVRGRSTRKPHTLVAGGVNRTSGAVTCGQVEGRSSGPGRIRTCDLGIRSPSRGAPPERRGPTALPGETNDALLMPRRSGLAGGEKEKPRICGASRGVS